MNTLVDESIFGEDGKVDSYKMRPIIYDAMDLVCRVEDGPAADVTSLSVGHSSIGVLITSP